MCHNSRSRDVKVARIDFHPRSVIDLSAAGNCRPARNTRARRLDRRKAHFLL
jgi:hypothetical protein